MQSAVLKLSCLWSRQLLEMYLNANKACVGLDSNEVGQLEKLFGICLYFDAFY